MKVKRSLVIVDDRAVLVDGIRAVAQFTYPELCVTSGAEGLELLAQAARPARFTGAEKLVVILGGSALGALSRSREVQALQGRGASVIAILGTSPTSDIGSLRSAGISVFVCASEGINELLRAMARAFENEVHVSPDAEALLSTPQRIAPRISPRERQIVHLYLSENDWSVDDVARMLHISAQTVRSHLARLRSHFTSAGFSVRNRLELRQALLEVGALEVAPAAAPYAVPAPFPIAVGESRFRFSGEPEQSTMVG